MTLLLSKGNYAVRGTVRNPGDDKNAHLKALDGTGERLQLVRADLLDYDSVASAVSGCEGVFHVASPVPSGRSTNPEVEIIAPALTGTLNVLKACYEAKVKRVVMVSSIAAVFNNPNWPKGKALDEESWSDADLCRKSEVTRFGISIRCPWGREKFQMPPQHTYKYGIYPYSGLESQIHGLKILSHFHMLIFSDSKDWYYLSKTLAEREAFAYAEKTGLDIVTICPSLVIDPLMQSTVNASSKVLLNYLKGEHETVENKIRNLVDVRDVADALLLTYENTEASGRYICSSPPIKVSDMINILKTLYPIYAYPKNFAEVEHNIVFSSEKLQKLGWTFRPIEKTLGDSVEPYRASGILN